METGRGIIVNSYGQTSDQHIFALGDCAETSQGWQPYIAPINQAIPSMVRSLLGEVTPVILSATPVIVKTPLMPLSVFPVSTPAYGEWIIEQQGEDMTAAFYTPEGVMTGFALLGKHAQSMRAKWLGQLSLKQTAA